MTDNRYRAIFSYDQRQLHTTSKDLCLRNTKVEVLSKGVEKKTCFIKHYYIIMLFIATLEIRK